MEYKILVVSENKQQRHSLKQVLGLFENMEIHACRYGDVKKLLVYNKNEYDCVFAIDDRKRGSEIIKHDIGDYEKMLKIFDFDSCILLGDVEKKLRMLEDELK